MSEPDTATELAAYNAGWSDAEFSRKSWRNPYASVAGLAAWWDRGFRDRNLAVYRERQARLTPSPPDPL